MAIAGSLRITSALTLIDEAAKEELREGKNGAPVRGQGSGRRGLWSVSDCVQRQLTCVLAYL